MKSNITIHTIIEMMHSDPNGISLKFGIPLRTVYGWCSGTRTPPEYVLMMMLQILLLEGRLKIYGNSEKRLGSGMESDPEAEQDISEES